MNDKFFDLKSEKQDRMINASLKIFAKNGYKHASTDDIVKEAGISKGLLFHYFGSKIGLYSFLIDYSVKYMMFELSRSIGEERQYFEFLEKQEAAKLNVLRNYPYMNEFLDMVQAEGKDDIDSSAKDALNTYVKAIADYKNRVEIPKLKSGVDIEQIENIIGYTIKGISTTLMEQDNFKPETLHQQISEYLRTFKILIVNS